MRRAAMTLALASACVCAPSLARAQQSSVSGAVGGGLVGDRAAAVFDVGLDVSGDSYALGLGGRLRVVGDQVREEEWDEPSELARMLRYLTYVRGDAAGVRATFAAGELGDATLGQGAVLDGYGSGLDVDHGHLGAQLRTESDRFAVDAIVDDVVRPRLIGGHVVARSIGDVQLGGSVVADLRAPAMAGPEVLPVVSVVAGRDWFSRRVHTYAEAVGVVGTAAGLHVGARTAWPTRGGRVLLRARGEARVGTGGYVPAWMGPLYELERVRRLDRARRGGMAGTSGTVAVGVDVREVGRVDLALRQRRGLSDVVTARVVVPHSRRVQGALTVAAEDGDAGSSRHFVVSGELRARLPARLFVSVEAARLYRHTADMAEPMWLASAAVGGVLGVE